MTWPVYNSAKDLRKEIRILTKKFPRQEQYCLTSQLWRAMDSVILNIAEGAYRSSDKDFARFLNNSISSLNEVVACIDLAFDEKYINKDEFDQILSKTENIARQLMAFYAKVRRSIK